MSLLPLIFFKYFIYLFLDRGKGGRKRGRETSMCGCLSHHPSWGPGPQPRHVPWLGIEPVTLWFTGQHLVYWTTLVKAATSVLTQNITFWGMIQQITVLTVYFYVLKNVSLCVDTHYMDTLHILLFYLSVNGYFHFLHSQEFILEQCTGSCINN